MGGDLATALAVSGIHGAAMIAAGGLMAYSVHAWLGLGALRRSWVNLEAVWALSLVLVGGVALAWPAAG